MEGTRVAVVGAGVAGLAAAVVLRRHGLTATVFERGPRVGGRAITVERGSARFDAGAQFFRTEGGPFDALIHETLPGDALVDIRAEVRPFDAAGNVGAGDPAQNTAPKWVYRQGLGQLAALLVRAGQPRIHLGRDIVRIGREGSGWRLSGSWGEAGPFAAVILALPGPAAARLLDASPLPPAAQDLRDALAASRYRPIVSIAYGFAAPTRRDPALYALVNSDRAHAVSWVGYEEAKPGYVPSGRGLVVAQMAASWSAPRLGLSYAALAREAWPHVRGLIGEPQQPLWAEAVPWPAALPDVLVDAEALRALEPEGLFFAGDLATGGRIQLAAADGLAAGERAAVFLGA